MGILSMEYPVSSLKQSFSMASIKSQVRFAWVTFLILGESRYNDVLRRYEIFLMPINTTKEGQLKITCDDVHI
jgi:hypothetical protein